MESLLFGLKSETIESGRTVSDVVNRVEFRGIRKRPDLLPLAAKEISDFLVSQTPVASSNVRRSVLREDCQSVSSALNRNVLLHSRRGWSYHRALRGRSRYSFHRLNGVDGQLSGKALTLLVADRLSIDGKRRLRMVSSGWKNPFESATTPGESVIASLSLDPPKTSAACPGSDIHVAMRIGNRFQQVGPRCFDRDCLADPTPTANATTMLTGTVLRMFRSVATSKPLLGDLR